MTTNPNPSRPVALITGASRGLGAVLATFLAGKGYDLIITARGQQALDSAADKARIHGGKVLPISGDISDNVHHQQIIEAVGSLGRLDVLINNASELGPSPLPTLADFPLDALNHIFAINFIAPLALIQETLPYLRVSHGLIINISSDAALGGYEGWGGYGASKAALDLLSLTLANELEDDGVAVVSVDPGDMRTDMHQLAFPDEDISDRPLPEVTLPFWGWLLGQERQAISGKRYKAQAETWEVAS
jgi:NAD(P)-dependent dehydrogenase (short-subunit alcohol dehydrogenase family)